MSLNIKNEETCRLAAELAELTGETKTGAITVALRERLERERREKDAEVAQRLADMRAIAKRAAARLRGTGLTSTNFNDYLYDEHGLPK